MLFVLKLCLDFPYTKLKVSSVLPFQKSSCCELLVLFVQAKTLLPVQLSDVPSVLLALSLVSVC